MRPAYAAFMWVSFCRAGHYTDKMPCHEKKREQMRERESEGGREREREITAWSSAWLTKRPLSTFFGNGPTILSCSHSG